MINSVSANNYDRPNPGMDPDSYAKYYAQQNNISVDAAKEELKAKYGDPVKPQQNTASIFSTTNTDSESSLVDLSALGDMDLESIEDLSTEDALSTLKNMFQRLLNILKGNNGPENEGDPQDIGQEDAKVGSNQQERLPESKADRDKYAQEYADKNNITLEEAKEILKSKEPSKSSFSATI